MAHAEIKEPLQYIYWHSIVKSVHCHLASALNLVKFKAEAKFY